MAERDTEDFRKGSTRALSIPTQSEAPRDSFLLNPREVRKWAEELPVANIGETARQVYNTLVTFNRIQLPTLVRTEAIEHFREPVSYINRNISRHFLNVGFPLSSKARKAAQLTSALCDEMANAYKIMFLDQLLGDERSFNQKLVIVAAQRATLYLGEKLLYTLLVYRDYPRRLWQESHFLYAWASQNQVQDVPVKENQGFLRSRRNARSIENVYKSMALLATTNPYRLRQSQIRRIHQKAPHWAELARLLPAREVQGNTGLFFINLWSDEPPKAAIEDRERKDARFLALDLNAVIDDARAEFEAAEWESPAYLESDEHQLTRSLLRPLIRHWTKSLERKFPRDQVRSEIEAIVGLGNLMRLLDERRAAEAQHEQPPEPVEKSLSPTSRLTWNDSVFSSLAINSPVRPVGEDSLLSDSKAVISTLLGAPEQDQLSRLRNQPKRETLFAVLTYNQSVEGYGLSWRRNYPMRVRVGDVLGIRCEERPDDFGVAVTRWLRHHNDNELYLGLQILAASCSLVTVTPSKRPTGSGQNQYRGLLLSSSDQDRHEQSLLTNAHVFSLGTELTLITEFGKHRIRLNRWIESNNNFVHYQFEYLDSPTGNGDAPTGEDQFYDLWKEL